MLAEKLGLDAQKLFDISSKSSGQCWSMTSYCPVPGPVPTSPANRDYKAGFTAAMMLKDLKLAQDAAKAAGANTPLGADAAKIYAQFVEAGRGRAISPESSASSAALNCHLTGVEAAMELFPGTVPTGLDVGLASKSPTLRGAWDGRCCRHGCRCACAIRAEGALREVPAARGRVPARLHRQGARVRRQLQIRRTERRGRHQHPAAKHQQRASLHHPVGLGVPLQDAAGRPAANPQLRDAVGPASACKARSTTRCSIRSRR